MVTVITAMELNRRIEAFLKAQNISVSKAERECGFSNGSLAVALKDDRAIGVDRLEKILKQYPTLSAEWLMTGRGEMYRPDVPLVESLYKQIASLERTEKTQQLLIEELKTQLDECRNRNKDLSKR